MMKKVIGILFLLVVVIFIGLRTYQYVGCKIAQNDLGYPASIGWVSGKCIVDTPKGKVYLNSLRGYGNDTDSH